MGSRAGSSGPSRALEGWNELDLLAERPAGRGSLHLSRVRAPESREILMTFESAALIAVFLLAALACVKPLGLYIANVVEGRPIWPLRVGASIERLFYRLSGIDASREMGWKEY